MYNQSDKSDFNINWLLARLLSCRGLAQDCEGMIALSLKYNIPLPVGFHQNYEEIKELRDFFEAACAADTDEAKG